eukprot:2708552-Pleurochrysis_carterae.AAC.2
MIAWAAPMVSRKERERRKHAHSPSDSAMQIRSCKNEDRTRMADTKMISPQRALGQAEMQVERRKV